MAAGKSPKIRPCVGEVVDLFPTAPPCAFGAPPRFSRRRGGGGAQAGAGSLPPRHRVANPPMKSAFGESRPPAQERRSPMRGPRGQQRRARARRPMAEEARGAKRSWRHQAAGAPPNTSDPRGQAPKRELPARNPAHRRGTARGRPQISFSSRSAGLPDAMPSGRYGDEANQWFYPGKGARRRGASRWTSNTRVPLGGLHPSLLTGAQTGASRPPAPGNQKSESKVDATSAILVAHRGQPAPAAAGGLKGRGNSRHGRSRSQAGAAGGSVAGHGCLGAPWVSPPAARPSKDKAIGLPPGILLGCPGSALFPPPRRRGGWGR